MLSFKDWFLQKESSPFTRLRRAAALGLMPAPASLHSKSTASPFEVSKLSKKGKKKKSKKKKEE